MDYIANATWGLLSGKKFHIQRDGIVCFFVKFIKYAMLSVLFEGVRRILRIFFHDSGGDKADFHGERQIFSGTAYVKVEIRTLTDHGF